MIEKIRNFINGKPWLGWALASVILIGAIVMYYSLSGGGGKYASSRMAEQVLIRCTETGDEWTMTRGLLEKSLRGRGDTVDGSVGLINPKTGKATGFPIDSSWKEMITRINKEKEEIKAGGGVRRHK
ncbi:MAG: hypothetical protein H7210_01205 [Pyrinomonadaceae bacterium]|nr:hypothetical protein [Phycisphaerales bacterium]